MYYAFIENGNINGCGQCRMTSEEVENIEISEEVFTNIEKYVYADGQIILDPDYEARQAQKERERLNLLSLTKREVFLGLYQAKGVTPNQIKSQITDTAALIEFEYANDYYRGNPLIDTVGAALGITAKQLDKFFDEAKKGNSEAYKYLTVSEEELTAEEGIAIEDTTNTTGTTEVSDEVDSAPDTAEEVDTNTAE